MLGKWETEMGSIEGQRGTSSHERRWAKGRHCLRMTWSALENGESVHAYGISGWNAEKKAVIEHWYDTAGRYTTVMWPLKDMNKDMWKGTGGRTYADGTVENGTCQLEKGDGQWVFTFAGKKNGEETGVRNVTKKVD